jgi:uncharacterized protein (TIGR02466 family)
MRRRQVFVTEIYESALGGPRSLRANLEKACLAFARQDSAGQRWCRRHGYPGYTSYSSIGNLPERDPDFAELARRLTPHVTRFAENCAFDLGGRKLRLDSLWVNILDPDGMHSGHIHPHSVVSGTYYVAVPAGASAIRFEDPRLPLMMTAPARAASAPPSHRPFLYLLPRPGKLLLWESWLRHEVPRNQAKQSRISISFNYGWS